MRVQQLPSPPPKKRKKTTKERKKERKKEKEKTHKNNNNQSTDYSEKAFNLHDVTAINLRSVTQTMTFRTAFRYFAVSCKTLVGSRTTTEQGPY